ncbi:hypothetical protein EAE96_000167 [Botrytis aclada]|nr:hypothetical protein EAE96_000167 [Botrytis aclada]
MWILSFLYSQLLVSLPVPTRDFTDETIIITGANTGLGLEAARHVSRLNARLLILAVRSQSKGEAAKASILASTGRPESSIEVWSLDMQSVSSIQAFSSKVDKLPRVDAVLANAGIVATELDLTKPTHTLILLKIRDEPSFFTIKVPSFSQIYSKLLQCTVHTHSFSNKKVPARNIQFRIYNSHYYPTKRLIFRLLSFFHPVQSSCIFSFCFPE